MFGCAGDGDAGDDVNTGPQSEGVNKGTDEQFHATSLVERGHADRWVVAYSGCHGILPSGAPNQSVLTAYNQSMTIIAVCEEVPIK